MPECVAEVLSARPPPLTPHAVDDDPEPAERSHQGTRVPLMYAAQLRKIGHWKAMPTE